MSELTTVNAIEKFRTAMTAGIESIAIACQIYVDQIDHDPSVKERFKAAMPEVPVHAWRTFERVGRGTLDRRLMFGGGNAQAELRRLNTSDQKEALDKGVKLLTKSGDSLIVKVENLTAAQKTQVFTKDKVRDMAAQRAWREDRQHSIVVENEAPKYEVKNGRLEVYRPCKLSKQELAVILAEVV